MRRIMTGRAGLSRRHLMRASAACLAGLALPRAGSAASQAIPRRIVTIGSDITETVARIDGLSRIVAVDSGSRRPPGVEKLPRVGFMRSLSAEGVVGATPDLIVATSASGPPDVIKQITDAGIRLETLPVSESVEGILAKTLSIGALIDRSAAAARLAQDIAAQAAALRERLSGVTARPKVLFVVGLAASAPLAAGAIPAISGAIALAGGENAGNAWTSVKPVSREALYGMQISLVLTTSEILGRAGGPEGFLRLTGLSELASLSADRAMAIDTDPFFLFGPSTVELATEVARKLHPERFADTRPG